MKFEKLFSNDEIGLVAEMVLGMKNFLSIKTYEKMQKSSLIHIVVASGGNIAIIASFLKFFYNKERIINLFYNFNIFIFGWIRTILS